MRRRRDRRLRGPGADRAGGRPRAAAREVVEKLVSWAEQRVPSGLAALIIASVPIWMAVLQGVERRRRPPAALAGGLLLGLGGLVLLVAPGRFGGGEHVDALGAAALLFAALSWTVGSLYSRRRHGDDRRRPAALDRRASPG